MKLVIEIPDNEYHQICELRLHNRTFYDDAIRNGTPLPKVIEDIKADIEEYEADCILSDDSKECIECDKIVFGSIYNIIDKHIGKENE